MIGKLNGEIIENSKGKIIINVGNIGYIVYILPAESGEFKEGNKAEIWTHQVVKEDVLDLYGFKERENLDLFKLLISISGIGPKGALGVLSVAPAKTLQKAIATGNTSYLTKVSGIGKKSAEKIVLELKDKVGAAFATSAHPTGGKETTIMSIIQAMLIHEMIVIGDPISAGGHYGAATTGKPDAGAVGEGKALGRRVAEIVRKLS